MSQGNAQWHALQRHPGTPAPSAHTRLAIKASAQRLSPDIAELRYQLQGDLTQLVIPPMGPLIRGDGLWRSTCFEAFIALAPGGPYAEVNASPSGAWALYTFDRYRKRADQESAMRVDSLGSIFEPKKLRVTARISGLNQLNALQGRLCLGLSAVIEDKAGVCSYWALAHPTGKPDFHHEATFAARV